MIEFAAGITKQLNRGDLGWQQPQTGKFREGRKWSMNLLQALVILTLIILSTPGNTLRNAKVWEGGSPIRDEALSLPALETDESALLPRLKTP